MYLTPATEDHLVELEALYLEAFPEIEQKPFAVMVEKSHQGEVELLAILEDECFVGLAITALHGDLVLLDYFAVMPICRDSGMGSHAIALLKERYHDRRFLLEIEDTTLPAENHEERLRRKEFYLHCGLQDSGLRVMLVGVEMEVWTFGCELNYQEYHRLYQSVYGPWLSDRIWQLD